VLQFYLNMRYVSYHNEIRVELASTRGFISYLNESSIKFTLCKIRSCCYHDT